MKFHCDKCSKKYAISDNVLKKYGSTFRIRCQACKHIILIANPFSEQMEVAPTERKEWFVYINGEQIGPLNLTEVEDKAKSNEINRSTLTWKQGMANWEQASLIDEIKSLIPTIPMPPQISPDAFDAVPKTVSLSEEQSEELVNAAVPGIKPSSQSASTSSEDDPYDQKSSISASDFFERDFEAKKEDKDTRLLRSLTGSNTFGSTGIFVMYNQKRRKERYIMIGALAVIILISGAVTYHYVTQKPTIVEKERIVEKEKIKYKDRYITKKEYITIEKERVRRRRGHTTQKVNESGKEVAKTSLDPKNSTTPSNNGRRNLLSGPKDAELKTKLGAQKTGGTGYINAVAGMVNKKKAGLMICSQRALKRNPDIKTKAFLLVNISSSGRVNSVTSNFKPAKYNESSLANCLEQKVQSWRFAKNPAGEATDYKFKLIIQGQ